MLLPLDLEPSICHLCNSVQFSSVAESCPILCDPMNHSTPGLAMEEAGKERDKFLATQQKALDTLDEQISKQQAANIELAGGTQALGAHEQAVISDQIAVLARRRDMEIAADVDSRLAGIYHDQIDKLQRLGQLKDEGVHLKMAQEAAVEWKKTTDSIENGLTDALMRAFEAGKGFWQAFRDTLVSAFKTLVLKPTIQFLLSPVTGAIGSL